MLPNTIGCKKNLADDEETTVTVGPLKYFCVEAESEAYEVRNVLAPISTIKKCFIENTKSVR
jgi:hypothetical protein